MADHANDDGDREDIFIYTGGRAPLHVTRVRIDESVTEIDNDAFWNNRNLLEVEMHEEVSKVGRRAFGGCTSLRGIKLLGVEIIKESAFAGCTALELQFGCKLETIEKYAFHKCISLRNHTIPSVRNIEDKAFSHCKTLIDVVLPEGLETMGESAFRSCRSLRRIGIPFNIGLILEYSNIFDHCVELQRVDLVGGILKTIASLHLESWRNDVMEVIDQINQVLPGTHHLRKTEEMQSWIQTVHRRIEHCRTEHKKLLREATTLLELALWKAVVDNNVKKEEEDASLEPKAKKAKIDIESARQELRITSGASIVVKNVLHFLNLG